MNLAPIVSFLEKEIGLSKSSASDPSFTGAIAERVKKSGKPDVMAYLHLLAHSEVELQAMIQAVLVPETWFFREVQSFDPVLSAVRHQLWGPQRINVLSAPCSTGEEPYTLAILLRQLGLGPEAYSVDGIDLSRPSILTARRGVFTENSFRGKSKQQPQREFFCGHPEGWELRQEVKDDVTFRVGNLLDRMVLHKGYYQVAVCRNLLIYLSDRARREVLASLRDALRDDGLLVLGIAEASTVPGDLFAPYGDGPYPVFSKANGPKLPPRRAQKKRAKRVLDAVPAAVSTPLKVAPVEPTLVDPQPPRDLLKEARLLADRGELVAAGELCQEFLESEGPHAEVYFLKALVATSLGKDEEAAGELRRAVYLDPDHSDALLQLALLHERQGDSETAQNFRRRALEVEREQS